MDENEKLKVEYLYSWLLKSFDVIVNFSTIGIKNCILFNGTGCVVVLTFLGHLITKTELLYASLKYFIDALYWFFGSCVVAIIGTFICWFSQNKYSEATEYSIEIFLESEKDPQKKYKNLKINYDKYLKKNKSGTYMLYIAGIVIFMSIIGFICGACSFCSGLKNLSQNQNNNTFYFQESYQRSFSSPDVK